LILSALCSSGAALDDVRNCLVGYPGQYDHDRGRIQRLELAYHGQPGLSWRPQVDKRKHWALVTRRINSRGMISDTPCLIPTVSHRANQSFAKRGVIVDD
jgi:hypothetical protein